MARRSVRLWPILGNSDEELWEGVGEFLHEILAIQEDDLGQADIEVVDRVPAGCEAEYRKVMLVRLYDKQKRETRSPVPPTSQPELTGMAGRQLESGSRSHPS